MKRGLSELGDEESKLSHLLFNKAKDLIEKLKPEESLEQQFEQKPAWIDDDDVVVTANSDKDTKSQELYSERLKQKYETLVGTPKWAKIKKIKLENEKVDKILKSVGHLTTAKSKHLPKGLLQIKRFPKINYETGNEGPVIRCLEFHPKISVSLVAGESGTVSLFNIGGDVNNKLHSFKLQKFNITSAQFTPDGLQAYIASQHQHNYCIYDLVKAETKVIQLPQVVKKPKIFLLSGDGKYIAAAVGFETVYIIDAASRELLRSLKHNHIVQAATFSHNNEKLYTYGVEGQLCIWDLSTFKVVQKFTDNGCVTASCITTSSCGKLLATGSGEGIVNVYDTAALNITEPLPLKTISNLRTKITGLKFNSATEILGIVSSLYPNAVKLVHIPSYHVYSNFPVTPGNLHQVETVNFSPNSGYLALGNNKNGAFLYRLNHYKNY